MPLVIKDRVRQATTSTGTGTITLSGTATGFQTFAEIGDGNTTYYTIVDNTTGAWEVGIGTYTAAGTTLSRDTVLASSNGNALVNFGAGTKDVWGDYPAGKAVTTDTLAYPPAIGGTTPNAATFTTLTATGQTSLGGAAGSESLRIGVAQVSGFYTSLTTEAPGNSVFRMSGANAGMAFITNGTGNFSVSTGGSASTTQFRVSHTASAVNYVQVTGATTTNRPQIIAQGSDVDIGLVFTTKGSGAHSFSSDANSGTTQFRIARTLSAVNFLQAAGAAANTSPVFSAQGSDTNISATLLPKGTGAINLAPGSSGVNISNGGTVTAITRTSTGSLYTGFPTLTLSAPTTAGGVQATATPQLVAANTTVVSGGTGYTVNDVLTVTTGGGSGVINITVTSVSGGVITAATASSAALTSIPSGTVSVSGGTGTGATFTLIYVIAATFTITNAGSGYVEQPTVTFSGGGGSGAAAYATVGSGTTVRSLGSSLQVFTPAGVGFEVLDSSAPVTSYIQAVSGGSGQNGGYLRSNGTATNPGMFFQTKGSGNFAFFTNALVSPAQQFAVTHTASAVNYVQVTGAATGNSPIISGQGSDLNVPVTVQTKGTSPTIFTNGSGQRQLRIDGTVNGANHFNILSGASGQSPILRPADQSTDTNVAAIFQSRGTGAINLAPGSSGVNISNGGTVTAVTITTSGAGYTSIPSAAISAPTTAGGVQATVNVLMFTGTATVAGGGTGYTVGDTLTVVGGTFSGLQGTYTVASVSGGVITGVTRVTGSGYSVLPSNPVTVTGGTGSGATLNLTWTVNSFTITNAGSGYVEQPTVTFSGGGGSGAAAYALVGSGVTVRGLADTIRFSTPGGLQLQVNDVANAVNYPTIRGNATGNAPLYFVTGTDTNVSARYRTQGSGSHFFETTGIGNNQLVVAHTASAVNFVQVTGAATGNPPVLSMQGSDTSIAFRVQAKGAGAVAFLGGSGGILANITGSSGTGRNYLQFESNATTVAPVLSAQGGDTNIDLALTPKGTGRVQFGTYTATVSSITGYIEIKDAGGTIRRLAVVA